MSWLKKIFGSQPSQETKVYYEKDTQTAKNHDESKITESHFDETQIEDNQISNEATRSSQESWWSSWSGLSQPFTSKGEKRDLSDYESEEQSSESFCSDSTKKDKSSQPESGSSQKEDKPECSTSQSKEDDNKNDDDEGDAKVSFYLKVGKYKKFKYM